MKPFNLILILTLLQLSLPSRLTAQSATVSEETRILKTYSFHDPNPVPILTDNTKIYPYFIFDGYEQVGQDKPHKIVTLENDYIKVFVLPEEGGKIWGAIEKSTGEEFVYRNEVSKFRNISMRGPWTSGGIEFNFGIIGHHPSTASPVDYAIQEMEDGSVVCTVGSIDLPSRTQWRVKVILPPDKAYFETQALWYNPTPMNQSYYNWMTAAAPATEDLVFHTPGDQYLKHSGEAKPWPIDDQGRNLAAYKENNFGPAKSYHVVGEYNDFFGGYYSNSQFGFGQWSLYEEMPGQKLWIWALSRSGGIWEDLLTDTDGQYIEWQAGRLFDQFSPGAHVNPNSQAPFPPYSSDTWREIWFPVKEIGGLSDVSPQAVMHVEQDGNQLQIGINGLSSSEGTLRIIQAGKVIHTELLKLSPMQVYTKAFQIDPNKPFEVHSKEIGLEYYSDPEKRQLKRPFQTPEFEVVSEVEQLYVKGLEAMKFREFDQALDYFSDCIAKDQSNQRALVALAELYLRRGEYQKGLEHVNTALSIDTYNAGANHVAGALYLAVGDQVNALENMGWAARSMTFRSSAYAQMAEISLKSGDPNLAELYANKSLDYNRYNVNAHQVLAITARMAGEIDVAKSRLAELLEIDPLNHFAYYEQNLLGENSPSLKDVINNEFPYQSYLELGIAYLNKGMTMEALDLFSSAPKHPVIDLWTAYLNQQQPDLASKHLDAALAATPDFVFPYRRETIEVLEWANGQRDHWKLKYYLALNYWGKGRVEEAAKLMTDCGTQPDYAPFYLARADLSQKTGTGNIIDDLTKAHELDKSEWRTWDGLIGYHNRNQNYTEVLKLTGQAYQKFPEKYDLGYKHAEALLNNGKYQPCIKVMDEIQILPFEHSYGAREIYEQSHLLLALEYIDNKKHQEALAVLQKSLEWPENIGVGKPYNPDDRPQRFLLAQVYGELGNKSKRSEFLDQVVDYSGNPPRRRSPNAILGLLALKQSKQKDDLNQMIEDLESSDSNLNRWILARYNEDQGSLDALEAKDENQRYLAGKNMQILDQILEVAGR